MPIYNLSVTGRPEHGRGPGTYFGPDDPTGELGMGDPDARPSRLSEAGRKLLSAISLRGPHPDSLSSSLRPGWVLAGLAGVMAVTIAGGQQRYAEVVAGDVAIVTTTPGAGAGSVDESINPALITAHHLNPRFHP